MKNTFMLLLVSASFSLFATLAASAANSGEKVNGYTVGEPIPGYNCLLVKLPPGAEEQRNFHVFPKVFAAPTQASSQIGKAIGAVYVAWPINEINGFLEVMLYKGERGWISAKDTKPFTYPIYSNTPGRCEISMSSVGTIVYKGISLSQNAK